jgi:hypothetical protein
MSMSGIMGTVTHGVMDAAWGVGGKVAARATTSKLGFAPGSMTSMLVEAGVGVVGAMLLRRVSPNATRAFLQGAFMAPIETFAITSKVPLISDYLGDYNTGALLVRPGQYNAIAPNPGYDAGAFQGYPHQLAGYPRDGFRDDSMGDFDAMPGRFR